MFHALVMNMLCYLIIPSREEVSDEQKTKRNETKKKYQQYGQLPKEIIEKIAPGIELGEDGTPNIPDNFGAGEMADLIKMMGNLSGNPNEKPQCSVM